MYLTLEKPQNILDFCSLIRTFAPAMEKFEEQIIQKRDVALALSSGGARGLAHIGAIEVLKEQGYNITSIAGCSMGALIGGVYAAGKLEDFREWMKTIDRKKML